MLEFIKTDNETITVAVKMTKRQIVALYHNQVGIGASSQRAARHQTRLQNDKESLATYRAKNLLRLAQERTLVLGRKYFDDPSWHALLDLYVRESEGRLTSITSACSGSLAAETTALRHIEVMTNDGLLVRMPDAADKRRIWIGLARQTRENLTDLLCSD